MAVRQRRPLVVPEETSHPVFDTPVFRQFKKLDIYPKPATETTRSTVSGGLVSLAATIFILLLIATELRAYIAGVNAYHDQLTVDNGVNDLVPINFNITFPNLQCQEVNLDVMDAAGSQQINVQTDMYKSPVDHRGELAFRGYYNYVPHFKETYNPKNDPSSPQFCGKCYIKPKQHNHGLDREGGVVDHHITGHHTGECCNSCEEVMQMYDKHKLPRPHFNEVEQCLHELFYSNPGCNVQGTVYVQKVKGNFHFAPGASAQILGGGVNLGATGHHLHSFDRQTALRWNVSHTVHHLSFGERTVRRINKRGVVFPLDGTDLQFDEGTALIKYFIKVVPTAYQKDGGKPDSAYEFAVTRHYARYFSDVKTTFLPGLFFVFDFHPIRIVHRFQRDPLSHFLVRISGLVGGLFVVSGMLDKVLYFVLYAKRKFAPVAPQPSL